MIIHHDETQDINQDTQPNEIQEEEINDTGTMIIKKKDIEFTKSNNWHMILSEETDT